MKATPAVSPITDLVIRRCDLLEQLHHIDVLIAERPSIVQKLEEIQLLIDSHAGNRQAPTASRPGRPQKYGFEISVAVADLTRAGLSEREIGERLGIPHQSVANMQRREGARPTSKTGGARTPYGPEMVAAVKKLASEGISKRKIAKQLGIPAGSADTLKKKQP
jgi:hypothetical protein